MSKSANPESEFNSRLEKALNYLARSESGDVLLAGNRVTELLARYGSPLIVLLEGRARDNMKSIQTAFMSKFARLSVHYAIKASYHRAHIDAALASGAGLEVMSGLELQIALESGCPPERIICNGIGRDPAYLALEATIPDALHVVDSMADFHGLAKAAAAGNVTLRVALRVAHDLPELPGLAGSDSKLGFDWTDGSFEVVLREILACPQFDLVGMHSHAFTRARSPADWGIFLDGVAAVAVSIEKRYGIEFDVIDVGGGFDSRCLLETSGTSIGDFAEAAATSLARINYPFQLVLEPGRYIVSDAAVGIGRVVASKKRSQLNWKILDIASNVLIPVPGAEYPLIPVTPADDRAIPTSICFSDGTCVDVVLHREAKSTIGDVGTSVIVLACGAYTTVFSHTWGPLPPITIRLNRQGFFVPVTTPGVLENSFKELYGYSLDLTAGRWLDEVEQPAVGSDG